MRRDRPDVVQDKNGELKTKGKYLGAPGAGNRLYFPPGVTLEQLADVTVPIVIAEGEKKALALRRLAYHESNRPRFIVVAIPGVWNWRGVSDEGELAPDGRVMEMLSEHTLEGWLEGYLLTGRHGFFASYESFIHVIDSMINQHAKWLEKCNELPWRAKVSSLNLLITALVWRQDHNGFTHQDPGFLDVVANKSPDVTRIYLPPDANSLLR